MINETNFHAIFVSSFKFASNIKKNDNRYSAKCFVDPYIGKITFYCQTYYIISWQTKDLKETQAEGRPRDFVTTSNKYIIYEKRKHVNRK